MPTILPSRAWTSEHQMVREPSPLHGRNCEFEKVVLASTAPRAITCLLSSSEPQGQPRSGLSRRPISRQEQSSDWEDALPLAPLTSFSRFSVHLDEHFSPLKGLREVIAAPRSWGPAGQRQPSLGRRLVTTPRALRLPRVNPWRAEASGSANYLYTLYSPNSKGHLRSSRRLEWQETSIFVSFLVPQGSRWAWHRGGHGARSSSSYEDSSRLTF